MMYNDLKFEFFQNNYIKILKFSHNIATHSNIFWISNVFFVIRFSIVGIWKRSLDLKAGANRTTCWPTFWPTNQTNMLVRTANRTNMPFYPVFTNLLANISYFFKKCWPTCFLNFFLLQHVCAQSKPDQHAGQHVGQPMLVEMLANMLSGLCPPLAIGLFFIFFKAIEMKNFSFHTL